MVVAHSCTNIKKELYLSWRNVLAFTRTKWETVVIRALFDKHLLDRYVSPYGIRNSLTDTNDQVAPYRDTGTTFESFLCALCPWFSIRYRHGSGCVASVHGGLRLIRHSVDHPIPIEGPVLGTWAEGAITGRRPNITRASFCCACPKCPLPRSVKPLILRA